MKSNEGRKPEAHGTSGDLRSSPRNFAMFEGEEDCVVEAVVVNATCENGFEARGGLRLLHRQYLIS